MFEKIMKILENQAVPLLYHLLPALFYNKCLTHLHLFSETPPAYHSLMWLSQWSFLPYHPYPLPHRKSLPLWRWVNPWRRQHMSAEHHSALWLCVLEKALSEGYVGYAFCAVHPYPPTFTFDHVQWWFVAEQLNGTHVSQMVPMSCGSRWKAPFKASLDHSALMAKFPYPSCFWLDRKSVV